MARTGKGKNARPSNMPAMVTRLTEPPIFDYLDLAERHRPGPVTPRATAELGARRSAQPSHFNLKTVTPWPAAMWPCPGCGRLLISAVHQAANPPRYMFCNRKCRKAHDGD